MLQCNLLSYYLANKRRLHNRSQGLEIPTLIGENKRNLNYPPLPLSIYTIKVKTIKNNFHQS